MTLFGFGWTQYAAQCILPAGEGANKPVIVTVDLIPINQQSSAAVYYRADSDFSSPAALVNARLGRLAASDILDIELATALRAEGIEVRP